MKVYLETMGCQMNQLDSELVTQQLRAAGHELVQDVREAQVVLYNTCSVRKHAEQKVYSRLGEQGQRKASGKPIIVCVLGCMAQREGEQLRREYPQVDIVCGPGQLSRLAELIAQAAERTPFDGVALDVPRQQERKHAAQLAAQRERMDALDLSRDASATPTAFQAYVRVMRGCDKFCSYCIVPFVRGSESCRDPRHILEEVRRLVDAGRSEITLLGQTVNSYRWRETGASVSFSDLLARVSGIAGLRRLRFITSHPTDFGDDILQAMRDLPTLCPYIHVPAQSGSDAMLRKMNRRYSRREYDELIDRARAIVPNVALAGDFIVGFPGETEEDHAASAELIRRSGYKNSFIFKYSPRPGTVAATRYPDDIPADVKRRRNNELLAVQAQVGAGHHQGYVGQTVEVLVEGPSAKARKQASSAPAGSVQLMGRTRGDHIVVFDGPATLRGQYIQVAVTRATHLTLFGKQA